MMSTIGYNDLRDNEYFVEVLAPGLLKYCKDNNKTMSYVISSILEKFLYKNGYLCVGFEEDD